MLPAPSSVGIAVLVVMARSPRVSVRLFLGSADGLCQGRVSAMLLPRKSQGGLMKVNVEIDCTPEEARRFLGLPDVTKANDVYVDALAKAMKGVGSVDQLQELAK